MVQRISVRRLCWTAMIAALYTALSLGSAAVGLGYGPIQLRISELLCLLPFFYAPAAGGLFVGCILTNLLSPYGLPDVVAGSFATLLAACLSARCRSVWQAGIPPVLCNAGIVGAVLAWQQAGGSGESFGIAWGVSALSVGAGEAVVCLGMGLPLCRWLEKRGLTERLRRLAPQKQ